MSASRAPAGWRAQAGRALGLYLLASQAPPFFLAVSRPLALSPPSRSLARSLSLSASLSLSLSASLSLSLSRSVSVSLSLSLSLSLWRAVPFD